MNFQNTISKEDIAKMPMEVFTGQIVIVNTKEALKEALSYLSSHTEIGFDTETRPCFTKNTFHKMSLMQLSTIHTCFLIRLNKFSMLPRRLESFLRNKKIKKIGLSLVDDFNGLNCLTNNVSPDSFLDLQKYVGQYGIEELGLQKIYAILFGKRISKSQQRSNWDAAFLSKPQIMYAAIDAWACLRIYQFLEQSK